MTKKPAKKLTPEEMKLRKQQAPKVNVMTRKEYRAALDQLGFTMAGAGTAIALGIGMRQVMRMYHGDSPISPPVAKLLKLYLKHGVDAEDTGDTRPPRAPMAENPELRALIEIASAQAEKLFLQAGVIHPMYHAITKAGQQIITPVFNTDKDVAVAIIKKLFRKRKVVRYVYMNEAWILETRAREPSPAEWRTIQQRGLEHHPDRREVLMFSAENRAGDIVLAQRYILRPEIGKATLAPLKITSTEGGTTAGRMVGLLSR